MAVHPAESTVGFAYESITVAGTAIGFTAGTFKPASQPPATRAFLTLETAQVRYRYDGTDPTATEGHILDTTQTLAIEGAQSLLLFRAIRTGGTSGVLKVTYER